MEYGFRALIVPEEPGVTFFFFRLYIAILQTLKSCEDFLTYRDTDII